MKLPKSWVNKKSPTNPDKKEQHNNRKIKRQIQHHVDDYEWTLQLKDYLERANQPFQE